MKILIIQIGENTRISLIAISLFSGLPFMPIPEDSEIFSITTASGLRMLDRMIAMGAHCGRWEKSWRISQNAGIERSGGEAFRSGCSCNAHFYQSASLGVSHSRHASLSWIGFQATEPFREFATSLQIGSLTFMKEATPRSGDGLKRAFPTPMQDSRRRSFWPDGGATTIEMIEAGMDSLKWLVAEQHRDDKNIFVPIGSNGFFIEGQREGALRSATGRGLRNGLRLP